MRGFAAAAALVLYLGLLGYLAWAYPRLPATVPMQWDAENRPSSQGPREAFVGIPALVPLVPGLVFLLASRRAPALAWAAPGMLAVVLLVMHAAIGAVLPGGPLPIPVSIAVFIAFGAAAVGLTALALAHRRRPA
jgi:hypothetical protein